MSTPSTPAAAATPSAAAVPSAPSAPPGMSQACHDELADLHIPPTGPLDLAGYLNERFPTEAALAAGLSPFIARLEAAQTAVESELSTLMRAHRHDSRTVSLAASDVDASLVSARAALTSLSDAASAARTDVDAALAPARPVHVALENVSHALDMLDALTRLDSAVRALEDAASCAALDRLAADPSAFAEARDALAALDAHPARAAGLRELPALRARSAATHEALRAAVLGAFKRHSEVVSLAADYSADKVDDAVARLRTGCAVADAMGADVRAEVVGAFVRRRRDAFRAAFTVDTSGLVAADKRFAWLRRELRANWARLGGERVDRGWGRVFPAEWNVARKVADGMVAELRDWASSTLDAGADRDVAIMVSALGKTKEFETELDRRFAAVGDKNSFVGAISESFGPWMGAFVVQEDEHIAGVLSELVRDETWVIEDGSVLKSATELFLVIKKSMRTCASLDVRQPLFSLHRVFKKHLTSYSTTLISRLPGVKNNPLADSSKPVHFEKSMKMACAVVTTAQYCSTTVEKLEENLREIVEPAFATDIDHSPEKDAFSAVSVKGIQSIVSILDEDLEPELRVISEQNWASCSEVGDNSKFVGNITTKVNASMKELSTLLSRNHFRFLLEKFAASFISRFRVHVYKCKQMNNFGAQQLLLDTTALKTMLLGLPVSVHAPTPATFVKHVNREIAKVEAMLKVILTPVLSCVDTYVALVPDGSAEDLQKVLDIRGLKRADAAPLLLDYSRRIGPSQRLKPTQTNPGTADQRDAVSRPGATGANGAASSAAGGVGGAMVSTDPNDMQNAAVDSVRNLFGRLGNSLIETGLTDRLGQVSSQFETTTGRLKKEAAARWSMFGK